VVEWLDVATAWRLEWLDREPGFSRTVADSIPRLVE
jgi:hypothetical protein